MLVRVSGLPVFFKGNNFISASRMQLYYFLFTFVLAVLVGAFYRTASSPETLAPMVFPEILDRPGRN
ncbi:MAG: hypothetical protein H0X63_04135 [Flavobacteriales bacterium]|nr:hypothetical protein [Flavobacteriales bacterium]